MAYHHLDDKNIPMAQIGTPFLAEPPSASPVQPAPPPAPYVVPVAYQPFQPPAQPAYTPYEPDSSLPYASPAPLVPTTTTELNESLRHRHVEFSCGRYIRESNRFYRRNGCKLAAAGLMWGLLMLGFSLALEHFASPRHHAWHDMPSDLISGCEAKKAVDIAACNGKIGCPITQCEVDGSYSRKQFHGSTGACWCVDSEGTELEGSREKCNWDTNCETFSVCLARRAKETAACGNQMGCFISHCDADGSFSPGQSHGSSGQCWCVDKNGVEVNGTRTPCSMMQGTCERDEDTIEFALMDHSITRHDITRSALVIGAHALLGVLLWTPALASAYVAVFNAIGSTSSIRYKDFFSCFCCKYYCKLLALALCLKLVEGILAFPFVIPAVWWVMATVFAIPLHRQHPFLKTCGSIRVSVSVVHRHFCNLLGFLLLLGLLQVLGFLCLIVGVLYTGPLAFVALCYCYNDLIGINGAVPVAQADEPAAMHI